MSGGAELRAVVVIPARYASTRFPGKPLVRIGGRPMVEWVYRRAGGAKSLARVLVATDDERIARAVRRFGGEVVLTSPDHATGTDRVAEVAESLEADVVVNVQGDEPLIAPEAIDALVAVFTREPEVQMATLCRRAQSREEIFDPNTARVGFDRRHFALYFSRAPVPYQRDTAPGNWQPEAAFQHVGVYAYRREFLLQFAKLPQTPLEQLEKLEQLRALEHGYRIKVVETDYRPVCVDVPADVEKVEQQMRKMGLIHD